MGQWLSIINTVGILVAGWLGYRGYLNIHLLVNSRMTELLDLAKKGAAQTREDQDKRVIEVGEAEHAKGLLAGAQRESPSKAGPLPVTDKKATAAAEQTAAATKILAEATVRIADKAEEK